MAIPDAGGKLQLDPRWSVGSDWANTNAYWVWQGLCTDELQPTPGAANNTCTRVNEPWFGLACGTECVVDETFEAMDHRGEVLDRVRARLAEEANIELMMIEYYTPKGGGYARSLTSPSNYEWAYTVSVGDQRYVSLVVSGFEVHEWTYTGDGVTLPLTEEDLAGTLGFVPFLEERSRENIDESILSGGLKKDAGGTYHYTSDNNDSTVRY